MRRGKLIVPFFMIVSIVATSLSKQNYFLKDEFSFFRMFTSRQRFSYIGKINIFLYSRTSSFTRYSCHHIRNKGSEEEVAEKVLRDFVKLHVVVFTWQHAFLHFVSCSVPYPLYPFVNIHSFFISSSSALKEHGSYCY